MSRIIKAVWDEMVDVSYISPQPGISERFQNPTPMRADTDPVLNTQPWYHGSFFAGVDPTQDTIPQQPNNRKGK